MPQMRSLRGETPAPATVQSAAVGSGLCALQLLSSVDPALQILKQVSSVDCIGSQILRLFWSNDLDGRCASLSLLGRYLVRG